MTQAARWLQDVEREQLEPNCLHVDIFCLPAKVTRRTLWRMDIIMTGVDAAKFKAWKQRCIMDNCSRFPIGLPWAGIMPRMATAHTLYAESTHSNSLDIYHTSCMLKDRSGLQHCSSFLAYTYTG